jgi:amino acid transporter
MKQEKKQGYSFGTFTGVFTPSILTILGVIMYLRFGWVLGNIGLIPTLIIVTLSTAITFSTGLSISALATNMEIGGGGAYYIISRSLGLEIGAAIGLPLFLAQSLGISFYVSGFSESIVNLFPFMPSKVVGITTVVVLTLITFRSADLALKAQFGVLAAIILSLVSLFSGSDANVPQLAADTVLPGKLGFWAVFAVFFPAVTGIEAGLAMSGDLKEPNKSLPWGTLGAIICSYGVYIAIPIFLSMVVHDPGNLLINSMIMRNVARWSPLIIIGIWGATLSSAMGALLGAPRTLQALSKDKVIPRFIGRGFGKNGDPRIAMGVSFGIGIVGIIAGDLDLIAPILSMFFLTSYGLLNLSAGFEGLIGSPSWRPKFKVPWALSFFGAFGCFGAMFMINPGATFIAIFISFMVYYLMRKRTMNSNWGDMRYGILMHMVQYGLYKLADRKVDEKTWRPNILVLSGSPSSRWYLIEIARAITHNRGLLTIAAILPKDKVTADRIENMRNSIHELLIDRNVVAMTKILAAESMYEGATNLITTYGYGSIVPNTILIGDSDNPEHLDSYIEIIRSAYEYGRNLIVIREGKQESAEKRIDVWWDSKSENAGLLLALSYLLKTSPRWHESRFLVRTIADSFDDKAKKSVSLKNFVDRVRLDAETEVLEHGGEDSFSAIAQASNNASFVFLGMRPPETNEPNEIYSAYYSQLMKKTEGITAPVAFVLAGESVDFDKIFI